MNGVHDETNDVLEQVVNALGPIPARDPNKAERGKRAFLAQARAMAQDVKDRTPEAAVSVPILGRLKGWIENSIHPSMRKERFSMFSAITAVVVSLALLFGGAGATVYAAQDSAPSDALYPVKVFSEDVRLQLAGDEESKLGLLLEFSTRRVDEMLALNQAGEMVPQTVADRWLAEMDAVFTLLQGMDEAQVGPALEEVGVYIRKQDRDMLQGRTNMPEFADPVIAQVRAHLRLQIGLTDEGTVDPHQFQMRLRQLQDDETNPSTGQGAQPGAGFGYPWTISDTVTATLTITTPVQSQFGPGAQNQGEMTRPDEGYGPGEPACEDCVPSQGPQGGNGSGSPGGNSSQPGTGSGQTPQTTNEPAKNNNNGGDSKGK